MAESIPNGGPISWIGESKADEGAVTGMLYFGVSGSFDCEEMNDGSIPSIGKVWLRGRWNPFPGGGNRDCCEGSHPELSGEKAKGPVGLVGPPENEDGLLSVKALDKDVVL